MTFRQKYTKLQDEKFVADMVINSAYANMVLEGQVIAKSKIEKLYKELVLNKNPTHGSYSLE